MHCTTKDRDRGQCVQILDIRSVSLHSVVRLFENAYSQKLSEGCPSFSIKDQCSCRFAFQPRRRNKKLQPDWPFADKIACPCSKSTLSQRNPMFTQASHISMYTYITAVSNKVTAQEVTLELPFFNSCKLGTKCRNIK